jgi:cyanate permease
MVQSREPSAYRWVIEGLLILALLSQTLVWLAPAAILTPIIRDLKISLGAAGLMISIIALCVAIFAFGGALIAERLGVLRTMIYGVWAMAIGTVLSGYTAGFAALLACRVLEGLGFGLMIAPLGALVVEWFTPNEWPYINTVNYASAYIGIAVAFGATAPLYSALGSWHSALVAYGIVVAFIALLWTVLGRDPEKAAPEAGGGEAVGGAPMGEVLRMRPVVLVTIAFSTAMWVFQLYSAFLPSFFVHYRAMNLEQAGGLTSVLPIAGIFGALGGGLLTTVTGFRKPFLWPVMTLMLIGCLGTVLITNPAIVTIALVLFGVGASAHLGAMATLIMELPDMTPARVGAALAAVFGVGYALAFVSPVVGGVIAGIPGVGLEAVLIGTLIVQPIAIAAFLMVPETGPRHARSARQQGLAHRA